MKKLNLLLSTSTNIYQNLALEEYLIKYVTSDILLFYINTDAVVLGKHQNPWLEVNAELAKQNKIDIARRLSGGGTVFHDMGNINFSFIRNKDVDFVNFREHIEPISDTLKAMGVQNQISARNDIFIGDFKISGNAEHVNNSAKRILHHGTLLYNADLKSLSRNTRPKSYKIKTHAVASVRSPVKNIKEIKNLGSTNEFLESLILNLAKQISIDSKENIIPEDNSIVKQLVTQKYSTWDWNFGYTPQFEYTSDQGITYKIRRGIVIDSDDATKVGVKSDTIIK